jgi:hypothetical protein
VIYSITGNIAAGGILGTLNATVSGGGTTLSALSGTFSLPESANAGDIAGALSGKTSGSTLSLTDDAGGRVALSGGNVVRGATALDWETATSHSFTVRETLAGATNTPRDTVLSLGVSNATEVTISGTPGSATQGSAYSFTPTAANGWGTKSFALTGTLPGGLSFSTSTGAITGTPTTAGTTTGLNITVTDTSGSAALGTFSLVVNASGSFAGAVLGDFHGQSNSAGNGAITLTQPPIQGQFDRVLQTNHKYIDSGTNPQTITLQVVYTGQTIDGVTGPKTEVASSDDVGQTVISALSGLAQFISDTSAGSTLFPGCSLFLADKYAVGGTEQTYWSPTLINAATGSGWGATYGGLGWTKANAMKYAITAGYVAANSTRVAFSAYAQGERDSQLALQAHNGLSGDEDAWVAAAFADAYVTSWAANQVQTIKTTRGYHGVAALPYIFLGFVQNAAGVGYTTTGTPEAKVREGIICQQLNIARWSVRLKSDESGIDITDLGTNRLDFSWNYTTQLPVITDSGVAAPYKDNNVYFIDARGYTTGDGLHHDAVAQCKIGKALRHLLENIYGAGGIPGSGNALTTILPTFQVQPYYSSASGPTVLRVNLVPTFGSTVYATAYASGSATPTAAQVKAGTGTGAAGTGSRYVGTGTYLRTVAMSGLTASTNYDVYAVIEDASGNLSFVSDKLATATPSAGTRMFDSLSTVPLIGYSFRLLRSDYTGPVARVRRDSDNVELDIYSLDGNCDRNAIMSFCGAAGHLVKWYNQGSGNSAYDEVQASASLQAAIVNSGTMTQIASAGSSTSGDNKQAAYKPTGTASMGCSGWSAQQTAPISMAVVAQFPSGNGTLLGSDTTGGFEIQQTSTAISLRKRGTAAFATATSTTQSGVHQVHVDFTQSTSVWQVFQDGTSIGSGTASAQTFTAGTTHIIGTGSTVFNNLIGEMIFWEGALATSGDRAAVQSNQKTYFGTP